MKIIKSELSGSEINGMLQSLTTDIEDAKKLSLSIDNFINEINSGHNLSGESYQKVKNKLINYKTILSKRVNAATNLKSSIQQSVNKMNAFMGEDSILDDSELEELNRTLSNSQVNSSSLREQINTVESEESKLELQKLLNNEELSIQILKKEIEKRNQLAPTDSEAYSLLEEAKSQISQYDTAVSSMQESQIVTL